MLTRQRLLFINISSVSPIIVNCIIDEARQSYIDLEELESMFDWVIERAIGNLANVIVSKHMHNDLYETLYDNIKHRVEGLLSISLQTHMPILKGIGKCKVLITYSDLIISKSI